MLSFNIAHLIPILIICFLDILDNRCCTSSHFLITFLTSFFRDSTYSLTCWLSLSWISRCFTNSFSFTANSPRNFIIYLYIDPTFSLSDSRSEAATNSSRVFLANYLLMGIISPLQKARSSSKILLDLYLCFSSSSSREIKGSMI